MTQCKGLKVILTAAPGGPGEPLKPGGPCTEGKEKRKCEDFEPQCENIKAVSHPRVALPAPPCHQVSHGVREGRGCQHNLCRSLGWAGRKDNKICWTHLMLSRFLQGILGV